MIYDGDLTSCPHCKSERLCTTDDEICCTSCGAVLGQDCQVPETRPPARLNLYQATEVGTGKVDLDCAKHMHDSSSETSAMSNICVKLGLPIYAAQDSNIFYQKIIRKKREDRIAYSRKLIALSTVASSGLVGPEQLDRIKRSRPRACTRAHVAVFSVHTACRKYGLPRSDEQILEAVRMNLGIKRMFTVLKAYSLNEATARELGIECDYDMSSYYLRLLLSRLQQKIGEGPLYNRIASSAAANLQKISDSRDNTKAQRAFELALHGARLDVQI